MYTYDSQGNKKVFRENYTDTDNNDNSDKNKKWIMYIGIAVLVVLVILTCYFMYRNRKSGVSSSASNMGMSRQRWGFRFY